MFDAKKRAREQYQHLKNNRPEVLMWYRTRASAKRKSLEHTISVEDIVIPERCPILNIEFSLDKSKWYAPSVDRIDNSKGYIPGNVAVISTKANSIKSDLTLEQLQRLVTYMNDGH